VVSPGVGESPTVRSVDSGGPLVCGPCTLENKRMAKASITSIGVLRPTLRSFATPEKRLSVFLTPTTRGY
jgi:hypothetical protein